MLDESSVKRNPWRRRCLVVMAAWMTFTILISFPVVRGIFAYPLYEHDTRAAGDAAYVMAGGCPYMKRLRAASDLYHWERVSRIIISNETRSAGYDFVLRRSETRAERAIDYLMLHGVPRDSITMVDADEAATFGSLSEARAVAKAESDLKRLVVVTSAPHTRRSGLSFRRSLPAGVDVQVYAASELQHSAEIHSPIWVEYVKLAVYYFVA